MTVAVVEFMPPSESRFFRKPFRALIVEDSPIIALDLEAMLIELGAEDVTVATSIEDAAQAADANPPDIAFLDFGDSGPESLTLAEALLDAGAGVVFTTGAVGHRAMSKRLAECPVVEKPYGPQHIELATRLALGTDS